MKYEITKRITDGNMPSHLSQTDFMQYKAEQKEIRDTINAVAVAAGRGKVFNNDLDDFSKYHVVAPSAMLIGANGIAKKPTFKIIKRETPIDVVEYDNDGKAVIAANMARTIAEMFCLSKTRGKYNDGEILSMADSASIELGEVQPNGGGFEY